MKRTSLIFFLAGAVLVSVLAHSRGEAPAAAPEALTGFDDQSNGFSDPDRRKTDQKFFEEVEHIAPDGLGPLYNAQSCRECHQTPVKRRRQPGRRVARRTPRRAPSISEPADSH